MDICVIGQGYVGLNVAIGAASVGHKVYGIDIDSNLISHLSEGSTYVPGITEGQILQLIKANYYIPTTNLQEISSCSIVVIAVPTPLDSQRNPDLSFLELASIEIGQKLTKPTLIINESTSFPGTLRNLIRPIIDSESKISHLYASAPERIDPGNISWSLNNTPRVIGGLTDVATEKAVEFYSTFCANIFQVSSPEVAEASKLLENSFRQINIALVNEFSKISHALGFSTHEAIKAAATKPFGFMPFFPSIGVGGHCIPVDPSYLSYAANKVGLSPEFIDLANKTNLSMTSYVIQRIEKILGRNLLKLSIQIVGIAYKSGVSDLRESPTIELIKKLRAKGAEVIWHDPVVGEWNGELSQPLRSDIHLGLIITPHSVIDLSIWKNSKFLILDLSSNDTNYGWAKFL
jgi:UDP-N-acetyl-D-glucosamine dehydrogenase